MLSEQNAGQPRKLLGCSYHFRKHDEIDILSRRIRVHWAHWRSEACSEKQNVTTWCKYHAMGRLIRRTSSLVQSASYFAMKGRIRTETSTLQPGRQTSLASVAYIDSEINKTPPLPPVSTLFLRPCMRCQVRPSTLTP